MQRSDAVLGIHHVGLLVDDLAAVVPFYADFLGLRRRTDRPDFEVDGVWFDVGGDQQLHLFEGVTPADAGQHVALRVADLEQMMAQLQAHGVKVRGFPRGGPFRQAVVFDPCGNRVELYID